MLYLIFGLIVGVVGSWLLIKTLREEEDNETILAIREKEANLEATLVLFDKHQKVTNNLVEQKLSVSDATATRYLEELEQQGLIEQHGKTGSGVFYTKK